MQWKELPRLSPKKIQHHIVTKLNSEAPVYLMDLHMSYMSSNRRDLRVSMTSNQGVLIIDQVKPQPVLHVRFRAHSQQIPRVIYL